MGRVSADTELCMGYAMCSMNAPDLFDNESDGTVIVRRDFAPEEQDIAEQAVHACPMGALSIAST